MSKCQGLARDLERSGSMFHSSNATTDGKRTVTYNKIWFPGIATINHCYARDASELEKELFESSKKKNDE
jgi:hypothetical protein